MKVCNTNNECVLGMWTSKMTRGTGTCEYKSNLMETKGTNLYSKGVKICEYVDGTFVIRRNRGNATITKHVDLLIKAVKKVNGKSYEMFFGI